MAIKQGYCIYCDTDDDKSRIFSLNSEATVCYCPNCLHEQKPVEAMDAYKKFITKKLDSADYYLFKLNEFANAYQAYAEILEIIPNYYKPLFGRMYSLLLMSTVRSSQILNTNILLTNEAINFHKADLHDEYFIFLTQINKISNEYINRLFHRLTIRKHFFDAECIQLYIIRIKEVIQFKNTILKEITLLLEKFEKPEYSLLIIKINKELENLYGRIKNQYISTEGYKYRLVSFDKNGVALLAKSSEKINTKIFRYRFSTLDPNPDEDKVVIKDTLFKDRTYLNRMVKNVLPVILSCFITSIIFLILSFVLYSQKLSYWLIFPTVSGLTLFVTILLLVTRLLVSKKFKKNKLLN
ncbi:MAG: hypothetical protein ACI31G_01840 [Bacilli bacterium]